MRTRGWRLNSRINGELLESSFNWLERSGGALRLAAPVGTAPHTARRDTFYAAVLEKAAKVGVSGVLPWAWSGAARARSLGGYWRAGDPYLGDPPHEPQGWYSIYDTDVATLDVLERAFTERGVTLPPFAPDPPWPPNAPSMACASRHHDDIAVRACESWCSDPSHCSYCKCKACAPLCSSSRKY